MLLKFDNFEIKLNLEKSATALKLAKLSSFRAQISTWDEEEIILLTLDQKYQITSKNLLIIKN